MRAESVDSSGIQSGVNRLGLATPTAGMVAEQPHQQQQPHRASYRHHHHHHHRHDQVGRGGGSSASSSSTTGGNPPQHHMTLPPGMDAGAMTGHAGKSIINARYKAVSDMKSTRKYLGKNTFIQRLLKLTVIQNQIYNLKLSEQEFCNRKLYLILTQVHPSFNIVIAAVVVVPEV